MLRSLYIGTTGMLTQRQKMNVITNNITNVETTGYKTDQLISRSFEDLLLERFNDPAVVRQTTDTGPLNTGTHIDEITTSWIEGPLQETGENTDMAIIGDGFFSVLTPGGVRYTRSGNFQVDNGGDLVTQQGYYVLGQDGGRIHVGTDNFQMDETGTITVNGQYVSQVRVSQFANVDGLRKMGDNTFVHYTNEQPTAMPNQTVKQGFVEGSNVDIGTEVANMLLTNRVYESNQRIVKMVDESLSITVKELAKF